MGGKVIGRHCSASLWSYCTTGEAINSHHHHIYLKILGFFAASSFVSVKIILYFWDEDEQPPLATAHLEIQKCEYVGFFQHDWVEGE